VQARVNEEEERYMDTIVQETIGANEDKFTHSDDEYMMDTIIQEDFVLIHEDTGNFAEEVKDSKILIAEEAERGIGCMEYTIEPAEAETIVYDDRIAKFEIERAHNYSKRDPVITSQGVEMTTIPDCSPIGITADRNMAFPTQQIGK